ncbi:hypothetical protein PEDI_53590 [Persicobacter diffluens]|uniref:Uncharacterized protein n=2 Tax=Persicobacter diffluens TaxID=981 RepID=A0AAN4W461_9BACT|nr:hypothetical protein PEDI_53590 [Persicobacter diffluens]
MGMEEITISGCNEKYQFEGPYKLSEADHLKNVPGVFIILCFGKKSKTVIDVVSTSDIKDSVQTHERSAIWPEYCDKDLMVAVYEVAAEETEKRDWLEKDIRCFYAFPCENQKKTI